MDELSHGTPRSSPEKASQLPASPTTPVQAPTTSVAASTAATPTQPVQQSSATLTHQERHAAAVAAHQQAHAAAAASAAGQRQQMVLVKQKGPNGEERVSLDST